MHQTMDIGIGDVKSKVLILKMGDILKRAKERLDQIRNEKK